MLTTQIMLLTKDHFEDFPKEKERFFIGHALFHLVMLLLTYSLHYAFGHALFHFVIFLLTYSAPRTRIWSPTTHFPRFGEKSEIYYSSITIHCYYSLSLFTCHYLLRIFAYLRGVVPYISSKFLECLV